MLLPERQRADASFIGTTFPKGKLLPPNSHQASTPEVVSHYTLDMHYQNKTKENKTKTPQYLKIPKKLAKIVLRKLL